MSFTLGLIEAVELAELTEPVDWPEREESNEQDELLRWYAI